MGTNALINKLREGVVEHPRRWSGDCHSDLGGSADYEATGRLMDRAADEIERLRAALIRIQDLTQHNMGMSAQDERCVHTEATRALKGPTQMERDDA